MNTPTQPEPQDDLSAVLAILREIAEKSADGNYLYRGEPQRHMKSVVKPLARMQAKNADRGL